MRLRWNYRMTTAVLAVGAALAAGLLAAFGLPSGPLGSSGEVVHGSRTGTYTVPAGIHKIKHVIIVMQENRSFDSYFGTYPGATGIPSAPG